MSKEKRGKNNSKSLEPNMGRNSKVLNSVTLSDGDNKYHIPMGRIGPLVAKIPVVLADVEVHINIEYEIEQDEVIEHIMKIEKQVFLKESKLIPNTNKLFIEGYVEKNIQSLNNGDINDIKYKVVTIPFESVTEIEFSRYPIFEKDYKEKISVVDRKIGDTDNREDIWIHSYKSNEQIYCELIGAKFAEIDFTNENDTLENNIELVEQFGVYIRIQLLQNQQIFIQEPQGNVILIEDSKNSKAGKISNIEVGFDPQKGMVGRINK